MLVNYLLKSCHVQISHIFSHMWNLDLKNDMNVKEEMVRDRGRRG
jgi:hypothetical protein